MVKEQEVITWDTRKGGLIATKDLRIGSIVLQSKPLVAPNHDLVKEAVSKALKTEGEALLEFDEQMAQLQNRVLSLKKWNPSEDWPDVSTSHLLEINGEWLGDFFGSVKKVDELKKISLSVGLKNYLGWEKQQLLDVLAPAKIAVPSGSDIRVEYFANGATPVLSVRLQELFGLSDTPLINNRKTSVVLHLLSPGYKPVQVTSDLRSFWDNTYFEVKKELKRRYPKHSWPEDPWTAVPVAKGSSRKR